MIRHLQPIGASKHIRADAVLRLEETCRPPTVMSDSHRMRPSAPMGEVEHAHILSQDIGNLFANQDYSDVTLIVEDKSFHAHRVILAARCQYFRWVLSVVASFAGLYTVESVME